MGNKNKNPPKPGIFINHVTPVSARLEEYYSSLSNDSQDDQINALLTDPLVQKLLESAKKGYRDQSTAEKRPGIPKEVTDFKILKYVLNYQKNSSEPRLIALSNIRGEETHLMKLSYDIGKKYEGIMYAKLKEKFVGCQVTEKPGVKSGVAANNILEPIVTKDKADEVKRKTLKLSDDSEVKDNMLEPMLPRDTAKVENLPDFNFDGGILRVRTASKPTVAAAAGGDSESKEKKKEDPEPSYFNTAMEFVRKMNLGGQFIPPKPKMNPDMKKFVIETSIRNRYHEGFMNAFEELHDRTPDYSDCPDSSSVFESLVRYKVSIDTPEALYFAYPLGQITALMENKKKKDSSKDSTKNEKE